MALETYTGFFADLVVTNPLGTDPLSQGDDHARGTKFTMQHQFIGLTDRIQITVTETEFNKVPATNTSMAALTIAGENIVVDGVAVPQVKVIENVADDTIANVQVNNSQFVTGTGPRIITLEAGAVVGSQMMIINFMADAEVLTVTADAGETINSKQGAAVNPVITLYGDSCYLVKTAATVWSALAPAAA